MLEMESYPVEGGPLEDGDGFEVVIDDTLIARVERIGEHLRIEHLEEWYVELGYGGRLVVMPQEQYDALAAEVYGEFGLT